MAHPTPPAALTWRDLLALDDGALLAQCEIDRFRASGPGGQKRNKTDSAVRLRHRASGIESLAVESRSQHENRARALRRLRRTAALTLRVPVALDNYARPSELTVAIRPSGRLEMGARDARFPAVVGALFDLLEARGWRVSDAAKDLGVTTAAIGRFLETDVAVHRAANERRQALGLRPLRA
ncbi:MAG: peptide chain release factor-like protein [Chloroflexi bacterium]|nr:peptide chain release factor-like protein [Chloroflexota bacterium]MDA1004095.1 peptide chain release factor-like protein [Chloroflexota bacterium]